MRPTPDAAYFADTPAGVFTAAGTWYRTRIDDLEAFAAPAIGSNGVPDLLRQADWLLAAPRTLTLWILPVLLVLLPWPVAAGVALSLFAALTFVLPALARPGVAQVLRFLDPPIGQLFFYVFLLSLLAARGLYPAVWTGLAGFVLLRWGLLTAALRPLVDRLYAPSLPDRVLRALIVRTALNRGVAMPEIQEMERSLLNTLHRRR